MYRFATPGELLALCFGILGAIGCGVTWPMWSVLFSSSLNSFAAGSGTSIVSQIKSICIGFLILGAATAVCQFVSVLVFRSLAQTQIAHIKKHYFTAVFRQEMAWVDKQSTAALSTRFASHIPKMRSAYNEQVR